MIKLFKKNKDKNIPTTTQKEITEKSSFLFGFFVHYFRPSAYVRSVDLINFNNLKEQGIKLIICDLDNTLVPHFTKFPTKLAINFINEAKKHDFKIIIISNNTKKRVAFFSEKLGVKEYIANAKKPLPFVVKKELQKHKNLRPQEIVIIGDMIIADILVANFLNVESILVQPIIDAEKFLNQILKWVEKKIFIRLSKQNLIIDETKYESNFYTIDYEIL